MADQLINEAKVVMSLMEIDGIISGYGAPTMSTISATCRLNKRIDHDIVRMMCADYVRTKNTPRQKNKKGNWKSFNNAVTVVFNKKAVKVFKNGKIHITGCKTIEEIREVMDLFMTSMMYDDEGEDAVIVEDITIHSFNVTNRLTKPGFKVKLTELQQKLNAVDSISTFYDPSRWQGLRVKKIFPVEGDDKGKHTVTALIFYTGTINLTGLRNAKELKSMFDIIYNSMFE